MAGETTITIIGNLTGDPELRFTPSGAAVANFTVASTPRTFDRQANEWKDGETLFMRCSIWRDAAENVAEALQRGTRVIVSGRLKSRSYETKEGRMPVSRWTRRRGGLSLRYANAKVTKTCRRGSGDFGGGGFGGQQSDLWATGGSPQGVPAAKAAGVATGGQAPAAVRAAGVATWRQGPAARAPAARAARAARVAGATPRPTTSPCRERPRVPSSQQRISRTQSSTPSNTPSLGDQAHPLTPSEKESTTMAKPVIRKPKKKANLKVAKVENIDYKDAAPLASSSPTAARSAPAA